MHQGWHISPNSAIFVNWQLNTFKLIFNFEIPYHKNTFNIFCGVFTV